MKTLIEIDNDTAVLQLWNDEHAFASELIALLCGNPRPLVSKFGGCVMAIEQQRKGKRVVLVYPLDKWVLMLLHAGAKVRNLGDVRWLATEDRSQGKGTGRHIACFVLYPKAQTTPERD